MPPDIPTFVMQYGVAGLIACMWLVERRHNALRDRQLNEAHDRLSEQRLQLGQLVQVVADNARALAALESTQRRLADIIDRAAPVHPNNDRP